MTYTATITDLSNNSIVHATAEDKSDLHSVIKWATVQGVSGFEIADKIGATCYVLVNCSTDKRARLDIICSDVTE